MYGLALHFLWITSIRATHMNNLDTCYAKNDTDCRKSYSKVEQDQFLRQSKLDLSTTYFATLENYETGTVPVSESKYLWIARVLHAKTRENNVPHFCTATCLTDAIFLTAARCISTLKVKYTTVKYNAHYLDVKAFVIPKSASRQQFDDVGFIIVHKHNYNFTKWPYLRSISHFHNRTDEAFKWFNSVTPKRATVVGYARKKGSVKEPNTTYALTELAVVVGLDVCQIYVIRASFTGFAVPCYNGCSFADFANYTNANCKKYHGVEGGAVYCPKYNRLVGVATWGGNWKTRELPVGFAAPNSKNYYKNLACALKIRDDTATVIKDGYYQGLCK